MESQCNRIYNASFSEIRDENSTYNKILGCIQSGERVLDVGCATGFLGKYLHETKRADVVGLDYTSYHVQKSIESGGYSRVLQVNLNEPESLLDCDLGLFDKIVLLDVLEHLYDPQASLTFLCRFLKKDGMVLCSLPNVTHGSVKLKLLMNTFDYTDKGIMDASHIRFFTRKSSVDLFSKCNLSIVDLKYVISNKFGSKKRLASMPLEVLQYVKESSDSYVFQFVFIAKKIGSNVDNSFFLKEPDVMHSMPIASHSSKERSRRWFFWLKKY